jgi:hypothetical protein
MTLNKLVLIMLVSVSSVFAQDIGITQVKVVEDFKPAIPEVSRLNENATFSDTIKKDRSQIYEVVDANLKSDYKTKPLAVAQVKDDKIPELYGTRIGAGFGSPWITRAGVLYNSRRSRTLSYGIIANHFANKYSLAKNSKNTMHLYVKKINPSYIFLINLDYDRKTALYYDEELALAEEKFFRNRFAYTKLSFSAISKQVSGQKLKHHTTFFVSDLNELSENQIHFSSNLSKTINGFPFSLEIKFNDYLSYNNSDSEFENTELKLLSFSPAIFFTKYGINFDLAVDFDFISDDAPIAFFPQIKSTKELVKDILLLYCGLRHNKKRNTLKSLSDENPYIHSFGTNQSILENSSFLQELKITDTQELYLTMRNSLGKSEVFEGGVAYAIVRNFSHFVGLTNNNYNRFQVDYLDVKQSHAYMNYDRGINDFLSLSVNIDYYKWDKEIYHKPNFTCAVSIPVNLRNKIKVVPSLIYLAKRESINYSFSELGFPTALPKELSPQFHANLGLYYSYSKQFSVYLKLNNLTNSKQDIWSGYKEIGFNGIFGMNYSF